MYLKLKKILKILIKLDFEELILLNKSISEYLDLKGNHTIDTKNSSDIIKLSSNSDAEDPDDWITVNGNHIPVDESSEPIGGQQKALGKEKSAKSLSALKSKLLSKSRKPLKLGKKEYASVMSEINTYYKDKFESKIGKTCSIHKGEFFYVFENNGYNNYKFCLKLKYKGNENNIIKLQEIIKYVNRKRD